MTHEMWNALFTLAIAGIGIWQAWQEQRVKKLEAEARKPFRPELLAVKIAVLNDVLAALLVKASPEEIAEVNAMLDGRLKILAEHLNEKDELRGDAEKFIAGIRPK
ncbi:hypothetical protein M0638_28455 [Roseomonas sp. NAR14]|uniref:Uncharacterized protein n=1 Tax=Roseomonas acroporae TaxID=2937791 RepID=A0A9X1YG47_9PROT|nr:hypothetical protein [Roseomonas acroporae]MCK8788288.1 hypothetical protein [Roseomonas acroporae]